MRCSRKAREVGPDLKVAAPSAPAELVPQQPGHPQKAGAEEKQAAGLGRHGRITVVHFRIRAKCAGVSTGISVECEIDFECAQPQTRVSIVNAAEIDREPRERDSIAAGFGKMRRAECGRAADVLQARCYIVHVAVDRRESLGRDGIDDDIVIRV